MLSNNQDDSDVEEIVSESAANLLQKANLKTNVKRKTGGENATNVKQKQQKVQEKNLNDCQTSTNNSKRKSQPGVKNAKRQRNSTLSFENAVPTSFIQIDLFNDVPDVEDSTVPASPVQGTQPISSLFTDDILQAQQETVQLCEGNFSSENVTSMSNDGQKNENMSFSCDISLESLINLFASGNVKVKKEFDDPIIDAIKTVDPNELVKVCNNKSVTENDTRPNHLIETAVSHKVLSSASNSDNVNDNLDSVKSADSLNICEETSEERSSSESTNVKPDMPIDLPSSLFAKLCEKSTINFLPRIEDVRSLTDFKQPYSPPLGNLVKELQSISFAEEAVWESLQEAKEKIHLCQITLEKWKNRKKQLQSLEEGLRKKRNVVIKLMDESVRKEIPNENSAQKPCTLAGSSHERSSQRVKQLSCNSTASNSAKESKSFFSTENESASSVEIRSLERQFFSAGESDQSLPAEMPSASLAEEQLSSAEILVSSIEVQPLSGESHLPSTKTRTPPTETWTSSAKTWPSPTKTCPPLGETRLLIAPERSSSAAVEKLSSSTKKRPSASAEKSPPKKRSSASAEKSSPKKRASASAEKSSPKKRSSASAEKSSPTKRKSSPSVKSSAPTKKRSSAIEKRQSASVGKQVSASTKKKSSSVLSKSPTSLQMSLSSSIESSPDSSERQAESCSEVDKSINEIDSDEVYIIPESELPKTKNIIYIDLEDEGVESRSRNEPYQGNTKNLQNSGEEATSTNANNGILGKSLYNLKNITAHSTVINFMKVVDGFLYTCSNDSTAKRFSVKDPSKIVTYHHKAKNVTHLCLENMRNNTIVFTLCSNRILSLFYAENGTVLKVHPYQYSVLSICGGWNMFYAGFGNGSIHVYNWEDDLEIVKTEEPVNQIASAYQGRLHVLVVLTSNGNISLRDAHTGLLIRYMRGSGKVPSLITVHDDLAYFSSFDRTVSVLDIMAARLQAKLNLMAPATGLAVYNGYIFTTSYDGLVHCYFKKNMNDLKLYYGAGESSLTSICVFQGWVFTGNRKGEVGVFKFDPFLFVKCKFGTCQLIFGHKKDLKLHVKKKHCGKINFSKCPWGACRFVFPEMWNEEARMCHIDEHIVND